MVSISTVESETLLPISSELQTKALTGNLLGRNQYCIRFSDRCNYKCSYCCNYSFPTAPKSEIETNLPLLINVFNQVDPGVILLSGGEPILWRDFPHVLDALPQHYWVILTNLTAVPQWIEHPNIKLLLPAYHEEFAKADRFTNHLAKLKAMGKPTHVKLIVKPEQEYHQIPLWEKWNEMGIPTSLTPLEYEYRFKREFLTDLVYKFRTSSLYNSRFFQRPTPSNRYCPAGTKQFFQINPEGTIVRCAAVYDPCGDNKSASIHNPSFNQNAEYCNHSECYSEWHHWGQTAPANDNQTWSHFIETGEWIPPTVEELCQFVMDMGWDVAGKNVEHSKQPIFDPASLSEPLSLRIRVQQVENDLEDSKVEAGKVQAELTHIQQNFQAQLQQAELQLQQAHAENEQLKSQIAYMQGSKFWRIRSYWLKLKQLFSPQANY